MRGKIYLLDANIVIRVWNEYPCLFNDIEKSDNVDFKINQNIAGELSRKEFNKLNGIPILSDRFIKLLPHIINDDNNNLVKSSDYNSDIEDKRNNNNVYFVKGNKISINDFSLIHICKEYREYILVTEDRKIINSARFLLGTSRVITFDEFIKNIESSI